jgi:outer membrane receptor protein involved in Fe transport
MDRQDAVLDGTGALNGGKRDRYDIRLWANYLLNDESQLTSYIYYSDLVNTRYQFNAPLTYNGTVSSVAIGTLGTGEQTNHHYAKGAGLFYNFDGPIADKAATVMLGVEYSNEEEERDVYRMRWGFGRNRQEHSDDKRYNLETYSILSEISYQIFEPINIRLGGRYDIFGGKWHNHLTNEKRTAPKNRVFSPKGGISFTPTDWLQLFASYGRGVSFPAFNSGNFYQGETNDLLKRDQYEFGYRVNYNDYINFEMVYYRLNTSNDITSDVNDPTITYNAGKTTRQGLETAIVFIPIKNWSLRANYTYQDAKYKVYISNGVDFKGHRLLNVPRHITNAEITYAPEEGLGGRLTYRWEADALVRDNPFVRADGTANPSGGSFKRQDFGTLDLQLSYKISEKYKITLDIINVLDKHYMGSQGAPDMATGVYTVTWQPPLTAYLGLDINWD